DRTLVFHHSVISFFPFLFLSQHSVMALRFRRWRPDFFARPKKSGKERALPFLRKSRLLGISTSHAIQAFACFLEIYPTAPFPREKWRIELHQPVFSTPKCGFNVGLKVRLKAF
ncbi:hypothetical protein, partial [Spirabiliibacterium mucosae]|uniref:hypothetical protein n=1 Tax=Spirabiliibacterium mucosae TaxID=28156 RepID=UPI001AACBFE6